MPVIYSKFGAIIQSVRCRDVQSHLALAETARETRKPRHRKPTRNIHAQMESRDHHIVSEALMRHRTLCAPTLFTLLTVSVGCFETSTPPTARANATHDTPARRETQAPVNSKDQQGATRQHVPATEQTKKPANRAREVPRREEPRSDALLRENHPLGVTSPLPQTTVCLHASPVGMAGGGRPW